MHRCIVLHNSIRGAWSFVLGVSVQNPLHGDGTAATSNRNDLLGQKFSGLLYEGRTLNDLLSF